MTNGDLLIVINQIYMLGGLLGICFTLGLVYRELKRRNDLKESKRNKN